MKDLIFFIVLSDSPGEIREPSGLQRLTSSQPE